MFSIEPRVDHNYVRLTAGATAANLSELANACRKASIHRVIFDGPICTENLTVSEVFSLAIYAAVALQGIKVASVSRQDDVLDNLRFFQTVAANRGLQLELFSKTWDALAWLRSTARQ